MYVYIYVSIYIYIHVYINKWHTYIYRFEDIQLLIERTKYMENENNEPKWSIEKKHVINRIIELPTYTTNSPWGFFLSHLAGISPLGMLAHSGDTTNTTQPSKYGGFHTWGSPQDEWFIIYHGKSHENMDDEQGYSYFRKPPYRGLTWPSVGGCGSSCWRPLCWNVWLRHYKKTNKTLTIRINVETYGLKLKCLKRDQSSSVSHRLAQHCTAKFSIPRHFAITARFFGAGSSHFTSSSNFTATPETWHVVHGRICAKRGMDLAWTVCWFGRTIHESAHTCVFFFDWSLFFHFPDPFLPKHMLQSTYFAKHYQTVSQWAVQNLEVIYIYI